MASLTLRESLPNGHDVQRLHRTRVAAPLEPVVTDGSVPPASRGDQQEYRAP